MPQYEFAVTANEAGFASRSSVELADAGKAASYARHFLGELLVHEPRLFEAGSVIVTATGPDGGSFSVEARAKAGLFSGAASPD